MKKRFFLIICAIISPLSTSYSLGQDPNSQGRDFVIRNVRIFDGSRIIPKSDVWIQNGMIKAVSARIEVPPGIEAIDASGQTLLPGLFDAHVHTNVSNGVMGNALKEAIVFGVTTALDMFTDYRYAARVKREQADGKLLDLADLRSSGTEVTTPNGHGTEYALKIPTISSPAEAQAFVDARIAEGSDYIGEIIYDDGKTYGLNIPTIGKETLAAVVAAAHKRRKLAVVHIASLKGAKDAIEVGADGLVHLFLDLPPDEELISLATEHHVFVIPTLSLLASESGVPAGRTLARNSRLEPYLSPAAIANLEQIFPRKIGEFRNAQEAVRLLKARRIPILAGTDTPNPGTAHGVSLLGELKLLVDAGLTPIEALGAATSVTATAFHLADRGQIAPGKRADLVLVAGDPTVRISDIHNIVAVWKLGVRNDRESYRTAMDAAKVAERAQRQGPAPAGSESGLVSDFDDGTTASKFGLGWSAVAGRLVGGPKPEANIGVVDDGAQGTSKSLKITGEIARGSYAWAGAMFQAGHAPMAPVNLSGKRAITFWTKGDGGSYQVMLFAKRNGSLPAMKNFVAGPEWKKVMILLSEFGTDGSDLQAITFAALAIPGRFAFQIDNVRFER
jgi:imidazolonepropionase-like amidohydrolase